MKILVFILSLFIGFLILNHIFNENIKIIEGVTNPPTFQEYAADPLILAQQNAGNIEFLRDKFSQVQDLIKRINNLENTTNEKIDKLQSEVATNTQSITQIGDATKQQQQQLRDAQNQLVDGNGNN